jgi:hypothetical protein
MLACVHESVYHRLAVRIFNGLCVCAVGGSEWSVYIGWQCAYLIVCVCVCVCVCV